MHKNSTIAKNKYRQKTSFANLTPFHYTYAIHFLHYPMLFKLNSILLYALTAFFLSLMLYPAYIMLLKRLKAGKTIREETLDGHQTPIFSKLHGHKQGTPTMGG